MVATTGEFVSALAASNRVILIGGLAVIAHGFNRPTKDADIWLDPLDSPEAWAAAILRTCENFQGLTIHTLPGWREIAGPEVASAAREIGMIRISGLDCPLDIFREPNEFAHDAFDEVFARSNQYRDGTWLPDPLDLIITKLDTGRAKDLLDSRYLESVVREHYLAVVPVASLAEVKRLFERFVDWEVCEAALENPDPQVIDFAMDCLREMAADGDPFALALVQKIQTPGSQNE